MDQVGWGLVDQVARPALEVGRGALVAVDPAAGLVAGASDVVALLVLSVFQRTVGRSSQLSVLPLPTGPASDGSVRVMAVARVASAEMDRLVLVVPCLVICCNVCCTWKRVTPLNERCQE